MDDFEARLRATLDRDREAFEPSADLPAHIARRTRQHQTRRRASLAAVVACAVVLAFVPVLSRLLDANQAATRQASPHWSTRLTSSHRPADQQQNTPLGTTANSPTRPGSRSPRSTAPPRTAPGVQGVDPPRATTPTTRGTGSPTSTTQPAGGTTDGGVTTPSSPDDTTAPDTLGPPGANVGNGTDPSSCISGPDALAVGQAGVFTASGADPYTWTPDKEGVFDVVLDDGAGRVCSKSVTVSPAVAGPSGTDAPTDVPAPAAPLGAAVWGELAGIVHLG
jgi:hypothetical protein